MQIEWSVFSRHAESMSIPVENSPLCRSKVPPMARRRLQKASFLWSQNAAKANRRCTALGPDERADYVGAAIARRHEEVRTDKSLAMGLGEVGGVS
jgi:hypothetical protein